LAQVKGSLQWAFCAAVASSAQLAMKGAAALLLLSSTLGVASATIELTEKTFKDAIEGKNAFVKFLAPW